MFHFVAVKIMYRIVTESDSISHWISAIISNLYSYICPYYKDTFII